MNNENLYNLIFKGEDDSTNVIIEKGETKIIDLIKKYLSTIQKSNLMVNNVSNLRFMFGAKIINSGDYDKTILEYFDNYFTLNIRVLNKYKEFNYEILEAISETPFSSIYKAKMLYDNKEEFVAVKKIFKDKLKKEMKYKLKKTITEEDFKSEVLKFNKEIRNMEICQCENSVKIYDYYDTEKEFIIIMELCDANLLDVLIEREKNFTTEEIKDILLQLNNAFKLMHKNKILHRDIKTNNILVKYLNEEKTKYKVLLCDYGISRQIASLTRKYMSHVGTQCYTAPEILNDDIYTYKCDLWSLGITIYQLYTGELPYEAESEKGILNQIDEKGNTIFDNIKDNKLKNLLKKLLEKEQKKRISWDDYFKDPFFKGDSEEECSLKKEQKKRISGDNNFNDPCSIY